MILEVEHYMKENINNNTTIKTWDSTNKIPICLRDIYKFYIMNILETQFLLLEIKDEAPRIDDINKQINRIETITNEQIILYFREITRYLRKSLIQNKILFIIENDQFFLSSLGLNLKK